MEVEQLKQKTIFFFLLAAVPWSVLGQESKTVQDSLPPALKTDYQSLRVEPGRNMIGRGMIDLTLTPIGEKDVVKVIQTLPGVAMAIEGGNAYYVRGGNMGGNAVSLDGVHVYGTGHLFGLTSVYSQECVGATDFSVGGFKGEEDNLTSSHIRIRTEEDYFGEFTGSATSSNFFAGGTVKGGTKDGKVGTLVAARFSPIGKEWRLFERFAHKKNYRYQLKELDANIYDLFGKIGFRKSESSHYELLAFYSNDAFKYMYGHYGFAETTENAGNWSNTIFNLTHIWRKEGKRGNWGLSYNRYETWQGQRMDYLSTDNILAIRSLLNEGEFRFCQEVDQTIGGIFSWGGKLRISRYRPGSSTLIEGAGVSHSRKKTMDLETIWSGSGQMFLQQEWRQDGKGMLRIMGRMPILLCPISGSIQVIPSPECSLMGRFLFSDRWCFEGTLDALSQFHHILEGIPMGWSLDMIIPADDHFRPERSFQVYSGLRYTHDCHAISAGLYWKEIRNLIFFSDATALFSSALAQWAEEINTGSGRSAGIEILYEKAGRVFKTRAAYTLSKTDRQIEGTNEGKRFPAKYDRRHILNVSTEFIVREGWNTDLSLISSLTFLSGHWETVPVGTFPGYGIDGRALVEGNIFTTVNNYRMPPYVRLDMGVKLEFNKNKYPGQLNIGLFNILNRQNPFAISFDTVEKKWKAISLFPIMPSINYRIEF